MNLFVKQTRVVEVPVTTLHVCLDQISIATLHDERGAVVGQSNECYWLPQVLEIDLATGMIKNWTVPTGEQLQDIADAKTATRFDGFGVNQNRVSKETSPAMQRICATNTVDCAPTDQQPNSTEIEGIKTDDQGIVDSHFAEVEEGIVMFGGAVPEVVPVEPNPMLTPNNIKNGFMVVVGEEDGKWCATCGSIFATSRESVFAAINGCAKKLGLGTCEINALKDDGGQKEEGWYVINDARTKDRLNAYVGGYEVGKGYTARTGKGHKYTAENPELALDGLISHALKVTLPPNAIVQTTDDATVFNDKQRYSIDISKAVPIVEPSTTEPDWADDRRDRANDIEIEDAPQPICQPARPRYRNPDDHSQTWTGRGKPPEWLQAKLDAGDQLTDYAISDSAA